MDIDAILKMAERWSEELLQNDQQLSIIGRVAVLVSASLVTSGLLWLSTWLGWGAFKRGSRGVGRIWRGRPGDPLIEELCSSIEASLLAMPQPKWTSKQTKLLFTRGDLDVKTWEVRLGGEVITDLFSRSQKRRLKRLGERLARQLQKEADEKHKYALLAKVTPAFETEPCELLPIEEKTWPGDAEAESRLEAAMLHAIEKEKVGGVNDWSSANLFVSGPVQ